MAVIRIGLGIVLGLLVASLAGGIIFNTHGFGVFPSVVAGIWVAWPFLHYHRVLRYNFLHPRPKEYIVPLKQAFAHVRDIIANTNYNFGDTWHISTADTKQRKIIASLRFTEEEVQLEPSSHHVVDFREKHVKRLLEMEINFEDTGKGTTVIQFNFNTRIESWQKFACDYIVKELLSKIDSKLGPGMERGTLKDTTLSAPPWWLIGLGVLALINMAFSILVALFK